MEIVNPAVEDYMLRIAGPAAGVRKEMEELAYKRDFPIVGPLVGRVLQQLAQLKGARRILELGSGFGYSAWWFAQALNRRGEITLTEFSAENLGRARDFLGRSGLKPQIRFLQGDALRLLSEEPGEFDIIFNDVDKHQYPHVVEEAADRLVAGGLLITDNVLWGGRVAEPLRDDPNTAGVLEYNRRIFESPRFLSSILPIRDGLAVSIKASQ